MDDILVFANSGLEVAQIFDRFVNAVGEVGLRLNVDNTVILTNEAQQPSTRVTGDCFILKIGPESPAKMVRIRTDGLWKYDAALALAYHMEHCATTAHASWTTAARHFDCDFALVSMVRQPI